MSSILGGGRDLSAQGSGLGSATSHGTCGAGPRCSRGTRAAPKAAALFAVYVALLGAFCASVANAELTASGNLFVTFAGGISPTALPRHTRAPVRVWIAGKVRTLSGEHPPALREVEIRLNRAGQLDTRGLPACQLRQLEAVSRTQALTACRSALVGSGRYRARITFPEQSPSPTGGKILAFNSGPPGAPTILAPVFGTNPVPSTQVIVFHIHHAGGAYGTVLTGSLPPSINRWGYLKSISLSLHRTYTYRGRSRSYLSASCSAPPDLTGGSFPFASTSMTFADGRTLSARLSRTCRVKQ
jgi:hypothetical protein